MNHRFGRNYWKYIVIAMLGGVALFHVAAVLLIWEEDYELTSADYYERESSYAEMVALLRAGASYRWQCRLNPNGVQLLVRDAGDDIPALTQVRVRLYKPDDATADRELLLEADGKGGWFAMSEPLPAGLWRVTALANLEGHGLAYKTTLNR